MFLSVNHRVHWCSVCLWMWCHVSLPLSVSLCLNSASLRPCLSPSLSLCVRLSLRPCLSASLSLSVPVSLRPCLSASLSLSVPVSLRPCLSASQSLSIPVSLCLSLCPCRHPEHLPEVGSSLLLDCPSSWNLDNVRPTLCMTLWSLTHSYAQAAQIHKTSLAL